MAKVSVKIDKKMEDVLRNQNCSAPRGGSGGAVYGLGFLGALYYYVTTAPDFWAAVVGFFKALLWPAFLTYGLMKFLGM